MPSLAQWLHAESRMARPRVDSRLIDTGSRSEIPSNYWPGSHFQIPTYWVPLHSVNVFQTQCNRALRTFFERPKCVLLPLHPLNKQAAIHPEWKTGPTLQAMATASMRTVFVEADAGRPPFFLKLSIPMHFNGEWRGLTAADVARAIGTTRVLDALNKTKSLQGFRFLRESYGASDGGSGGFVVREIPVSVFENRTFLKPFFSLLSSSSTKRRDKALVDSLVDTALFSAVQLGFVPALHSQNVLAECSAQGTPLGRWWIRDLEDVSLDLNFIARKLGTNSTLLQSLPVVHSVQRDFAQDECAQALRDSFQLLMGGPLFALDEARKTNSAFRSHAVKRIEEKTGHRVCNGDDFQSCIEWLRDKQHTTRIPFFSMNPWLNSEQLENSRVRDSTLFAPVDFSNLPRPLWPEEQLTWPLQALEVPKKQAVVYGQIPKRLRPFFCGPNGSLRIPFHPAMKESLGLDLALYKTTSLPIETTLTASPRSLVCAPKNGSHFGLKVPLDVELLKISRLLSRSKLQRAVAVNECLSLISKRTRQQVGFDFFEEPAALALNDGTNVPTLACIVRTFPMSVNTLKPGFCVFSNDNVRALLSMNPAARFEFLRRQFIEPLVNVSSFLMFEEGLIGDWHQQNVLFTPPKKGQLGTVVLRDLDSVKTDIQLRKLRHKTCHPFETSRGTADDLKTQESQSCYDVSWREQVRGEWSFLMARCFPDSYEFKAQLYAAFDCAMLQAAARHLGTDIVVNEMRYVISHRVPKLHRATWLAQLQKMNVEHVVKTFPAHFLHWQRDVRAPVYSLNAMVAAWKESFGKRKSSTTR
jgi:hypothetical protein